MSIWTDTLEQYQREAAQAHREARAAIAEARAELDRIEENLDLAERGEPCERIGTIYGVNAPAIFNAYSRSETVLNWRKITASAPDYAARQMQKDAPEETPPRLRPLKGMRH